MPSSHLPKLVRCSLTCLLVAAANGCKSPATLVTWQPAEVQNAVGDRVLVAPLVGPQPWAARVEAAVLSETPQHAARPALVQAARTPTKPATSVQLASATSIPTARPAAQPRTISDLQLLTDARAGNFDWLLMGEILAVGSARAPTNANGRLFTPSTETPSNEPPRGAQREADHGASSTAAEPSPAAPRLAVAWRLYDVRAGEPIADRVLVATPETPPLPAALPAAAADQHLATTAGRLAWSLLTAGLQRQTIALAEPWILPGSREVRRANQLARSGRWPAAQQAWQAVLEDHPRQHAARHNLAIAAVARQDYPAARRLIRETLRQRQRGMYRETAVWIELQQRAFHTGFQRPEPADGWVLTRPPQPATTGPQ